MNPLCIVLPVLDEAATLLAGCARSRGCDDGAPAWSWSTAAAKTTPSP